MCRRGQSPPLVAQLLKNMHQSSLLGAKMCAKVPSCFAKHTKLPLGWLKHDRMPSWEPKDALKCPLGSQRRAKVPSWEPKDMLKWLIFTPALQKVCACHWTYDLRCHICCTHTSSALVQGMKILLCVTQNNYTCCPWYFADCGFCSSIYF